MAPWAIQRTREGGVELLCAHCTERSDLRPVYLTRSRWDDHGEKCWESKERERELHRRWAKQFSHGCLRVGAKVWQARRTRRASEDRDQERVSRHWPASVTDETDW